jgi:YbgC/YbaW family acyl-CoA thioester hydrolase
MSKSFMTVVNVSSLDIDPAGLVYFGAYPNYLARAEDEFLRTIFGSRSHVEEEFDVKLFRREVRINYDRAARCGDQLGVSLWISHVCDRSVTYSYRFVSQATGDCVAGGGVTLVVLSRRDLGEIPLPGPLHRRLTELCRQDKSLP